MSANPTKEKTMLVNCTVNLNQSFFNFVTPPNMNTPVTLSMNCWRCQSVQRLRPGATSMDCDICKATTRVLDHNPHSGLPWPHHPRRAVICGISYRGCSHELKGSIKDAKCMKELLTKSCHFSESDIVMLTEEETDPRRSPTKYNLLMALYWLGQGCQPGDSLVFHYSGHGLRLRNYRLMKVNGYNETLCPKDFEEEGMIFDDEINRVIVRDLPRGVKLHAIIDSRHTNSVLDLPRLCRKNRRTGKYVWNDWNHDSPHPLKGTSGGDAISFSGYLHVPTSPDIPVRSHNLLSQPTPTGSMTSRFIQAIKNGRGQEQTYGSILDSMQNTTNETGGQEPLLSACSKFDVTSKFFAL